MPRPKTIQAKKRLCSGCRNDRYNYRGMCERPGIDAVVTSDNCWSIDNDAVYCRAMKKWAMPCHSGKYEQWITQYATTGRKPVWDYWR